MNLRRWHFLVVVTLAGAVGICAHPSLGFESPVSGPDAVRNKARLPNGASNFNRLVDKYAAGVVEVDLDRRVGVNPPAAPGAGRLPAANTDPIFRS